MLYLFFQTWIWLILAALLGLLIGWLIWGKEKSEDCSAILDQLDECKRRCDELELVDRTSNPVAAFEATESPEPVLPGDALKPDLLDEPDGEADDLKRIRGVGPALEKTLNNLGIFHFKQIAAFTSENINWVNIYLSFSGRIEREYWVEQARKLADNTAQFTNQQDKLESEESEE